MQSTVVFQHSTVVEIAVYCIDLLLVVPGLVLTRSPVLIEGLVMVYAWMFQTAPAAAATADTGVAKHRNMSHCLSRILKAI